MAILLALTLPLMVVALLFLRQSVREAEDATYRERLELASAIAAATAFFVDGNILALQSVGATIQTGPNGSPQMLDEILSNAVSVNSRWTAAALVDSDGVIISSSLREAVGSSIEDREYYQRLNATGYPVVSGALQRRSDGQFVATIALFTKGEVNEVFIASLDLVELETELLNEFQISRRVAVLDREGRTILDSRKRPDEPTASELHSASELEGVRRLALDGEEILVASAPVGNTGWVAIISEPTAVAFRHARDIQQVGIGAVAAVYAAILGPGWILARRLNRSYRSLEDARAESEESRLRAQEALASRDAFLSIASHELRNPAAAVKGLAQLLKRRSEEAALSPEDSQRYIHGLVASSDRLGRLINDLFEVSRLSGGRLVLRPSDVDLIALVNSVILSDIPEGRRVIFEHSEDELHIEADEDRIAQVIHNLLENALKYSRPDSLISLTLTENFGVAELRIADQGMGIPDADMSTLFEPFGRASNATLSNIPGLGLGLYFSRGLAEAHGGSLTAESSGPGQGAVFTLRLPLAPDVEVPHQTQGSSE